MLKQKHFFCLSLLGSAFGTFAGGRFLGSEETAIMMTSTSNLILFSICIFGLKTSLIFGFEFQKNRNPLKLLKSQPPKNMDCTRLAGGGRKEGDGVACCDAFCITSGICWLPVSTQCCLDLDEAGAALLGLDEGVENLSSSQPMEALILYGNDSSSAVASSCMKRARDQAFGREDRQISIGFIPNRRSNGHISTGKITSIPIRF